MATFIEHNLVIPELEHLVSINTLQHCGDIVLTWYQYYTDLGEYRSLDSSLFPYFYEDGINVDVQRIYTEDPTYANDWYRVYY